MVEHIRAPRSGIAEIRRNFALLDRFNFIVVEYEPRMRSVHDGNVLSMRAAATDAVSRCITGQHILYIMDTILANKYDNSEYRRCGEGVVLVCGDDRKMQPRREGDRRYVKAERWTPAPPVSSSEQAEKRCRRKQESSR